MKQKTIPIKINKLYWIANEYRKNITDETEIENTDMTQEFHEELDNMIQNKEIIIININGKVRTGKSTIALTTGEEIFELLKKYGYIQKEQKFGMQNIARDQAEHTEIMRNPEIKFTVIVTDEENELENTGENSTTYKAESKTISDVQAARYVHKVCCSPKETTDPNADILLNVIGIDRKTKTTHAKLYYKLYEGNNEIIQLLGYVRINVEKTIKQWTKIEDIFLKPNQTEKEKQTITKTAKKDWYTMYMIKKHEKMDMMTKEGIFRPRLLETAKIIRESTEELKPLCQVRGALNTDIIRNIIKMKARENKIPMSIIGEELAVRETNGILSLYKNIHKLQQQLTKEKEPETIRTIQESIKAIAKAINIQEAETKRMEIIQEKYKAR